jgi:transposase
VGRPRKYPDELVERALRLVAESGRSVEQVALDLGISPSTLRRRIGELQREGGGVSVDERAELRRLRRENYELRRANEILKSASLFFARELDQDRPK